MAGRRTPAIVAAERAGIRFDVHEYEHDPRSASFGLEAVEKLGLDPARVFKTLVADVDGTLTVAGGWPSRSEERYGARAACARRSS